MDSLATALRPLQGGPQDFDPLLSAIGEARYVLIGEASHGTHEFYRIRAQITKRLIAERGFSAVCIEGDWPDAYRVNRYVRGAGDDIEAVESLGGFERFPAWMWRNAEVLDFISWLREHNDSLNAGEHKAGFYGLDLYSMYASIDAVIAYLERIDPRAAERARERYACLERFDDPQDYAYAVYSGLQPSCRQEAMATLLDIQRRSSQYARLDGRIAEDEYFYAEQNARIVSDAEEYYSAMIDREVSSWNVRDMHMVDTLIRLTQHLERSAGRCKAVVWAHNSHVGNAAATSMGARGDTNIGALMRQRFGDEPFLVGFTTNTGTVTAASNWHAREERKFVRPARQDSYEGFFHSLGVPAFYLPLRPFRSTGLKDLPDEMRERAIGVIYRPETELASHYFRAHLLRQFDAVFHYDTTRAVEPLERTALWETGEEIPETYPTGV